MKTIYIVSIHDANIEFGDRAKTAFAVLKRISHRYGGVYVGRTAISPFGFAFNSKDTAQLAKEEFIKETENVSA